MCYQEIKKLDKPPRQKIFYKVARRRGIAENSALISMYTQTELPLGVPLKAKNVPQYGGYQHSYRHNFKGWGVFATKKLAYNYLRTVGVRLFCIVIRVKCEDTPRKAKAKLQSRLPCYLFNTITILDDGRPVAEKTP